MPRQFRVTAILTFALAILFFVFFDQGKHIPALAAVNSFNVDPYDAVARLGILLAMFTGLLSLVRAFRPYQTKEIASNQALLILRGETVTLLSIAITLAADVIAMLRNPSMAFGSSAGLTLSALVIGLALLTALASGWIYRTAKNVILSSGNRSWERPIIICLISIIILAAYPPGWDKVIVGGIGTALLGMVILFIVTWALATAIFPQVIFHYEDSMDDFIAIYRWLKARSGFAVSVLNWSEKAATRTKVRALSGWLNPRRHNWNIIVLIAVGTGIAIASAEAIGEGVSPNFGRFVLVMSVFIGIGGAGVLIGYVLLGRFLGIFRAE